MIPKIEKILYTTDLSENSAYVFGYAAGLANRYDAKVTILHVLEDISVNTSRQLESMLGSDRFLELQRQREQEGITAIQRQVEKFCADLKSEMTDCPFVVEDIRADMGDPGRRILEVAEEIDCDVIVMGTHGARDFAETMLGSTARWVVRRSPRPVLVVRLPAEIG